MRRPRVHLIECLDSAGAAAADAALRADALERTGVTVRSLVVRDDSHSGGPSPHGSAWDEEGRSDVLSLDARTRATISEWMNKGQPDQVIIASARPGGGAFAEAIPPSLEVSWWPTGTWGTSPAPASSEAAYPHLARRAIASGAAPEAVLDWSVFDGDGMSRRRLPLWDGDFVLAPVPLSGEAGTLALQAFATLAADWSALDLVVLAHPQTALERKARELGVGTRVHFVGPAPREAEWVWWSTACAALFAGTGAISGGLVLRGLAAGCPLLVAANESNCPIARWLAGQGALTGAEGSSAARLAALLEQAIDRLPAVQLAIDRGRERCAGHDRIAFGDHRLASALERATPRAA